MMLPLGEFVSIKSISSITCKIVIHYTRITRPNREFEHPLRFFWNVLLSGTCLFFLVRSHHLIDRIRLFLFYFNTVLKLVVHYWMNLVVPVTMYLCIIRKMYIKLYLFVFFQWRSISYEWISGIKCPLIYTPWHCDKFPLLFPYLYTATFVIFINLSFFWTEYKLVCSAMYCPWIH